MPKKQVVNKTTSILIGDLKFITPLTKNQEKFFEKYDKEENLFMLHGVAGTGKTYIALYKALREVLTNPAAKRKVIIVRSAVQAREIGHLPGDAIEKNQVYQALYEDICQSLFYKYDVFTRLQEQGIVQFITTSFIRGVTFDNSTIIVDECQNLNDSELNTIMTRVGTNSKIIFCGDFRQTDLHKKNDMSGLKKFIQIITLMESFNLVEFGVEDIVRSDLVKQYILARLQYEDQLCLTSS
jgi:phosphate starvation-inducible protein PhoH